MIASFGLTPSRMALLDLDEIRLGSAATECFSKLAFTGA
jgi:hypothetical protein